MEGTPLVNLTVTVPAGLTGIVVDVPGKHVKIVSCTAASVLMGFDAGNVERVYPDDCYAGPVAGFKSLRFMADVGACTVVIQVSEQPILGGSVTSLTPVIGSLAAIEQEIIGGVATGQLADLLLPASPAAGLQVFAANPNRKEVEITAPETNAGYVYLGITAARCTAVDKFFVLYPGGVWWSEREKGAIFASGSDAFENVNGREC